MAAVLCLILLPLMAAVGFMFGAGRTDLSASSLLGAVTFLLLGGGMFVGMFRMCRAWENDDGSRDEVA